MRESKEIKRVLGLEFPPEVIDEKNGLFYVPHEHVRQRLIDATDNEFDWSVKQILFREDDPAVRRANDRNTGEIVVPPVMIVLGTLTIPGLGSRDGLGAHPIDKGAGEDAAYKSAESDALKRAAMAFGVGLDQLYIKPGEAKRAQKPANRRPAQQTTARATSSRPQTRQHDRNHEEPINSPLLPKHPEDINDKEFDDLVRAALATKDGGEYIRLVEAYAGKYTSRWMVLVRNCETPQGLEWIAKKAERMGIESAGLPIAIEKRRAELTGAPEENNE